MSVSLPSRPADWQAALQRTYPIVTDATLDMIEAEALQRWQRACGRDPLFANIVSALRSLRQEVARYETIWARADEAHAARLYAELDAMQTALRRMVGTEAEGAAA